MSFTNSFVWQYVCLSFTISIVSGIILPQPGGKYGVTIATAKLVDQKRIDPFSPNHTSRALMISVFTPVTPRHCQFESIQYMPPATRELYAQTYNQYGIPIESFEGLELPVCQENSFTYKDIAKYPLIIFSPGMGNSRHLYNSLVQSVASSGYVVVSIDHPYDADIVEFPDGTYILAGNITTDDQIVSDVQVRVQDVSFVLDQLANRTFVQQALPESLNAFNVHNIAIFGHSLGGATAAAAIPKDRRFTGGINLDGTFFDPVLTTGFNRPFLIFGHEGKNQSTDATWKTLWQNLRGWKLELELLGSQHASFTDLPVLVDTLGLRGSLTSAVTDLLGAIAGNRAREIVRAYVHAFFEFALRGEEDALLTKPSKKYPEVQLVDGGCI